MFNRIILFFILVIEVFFSLSREFPKDFDKFYIKVVLALNFLALCSYIFLDKEKNENLKRNRLKFTSLFLLALVVVCYQPFIDLAFGFLDSTNSNLFIQPSNIMKTFIFSSVAVNSFLLGLSLFKSKSIAPVRISTTLSKNIKIKFLKTLNIIFFILFLTQINASFLDSTTYGSAREIEPLRNYMMLFFDTSFIALIIHIILNTGHKSNFYNYIKQFGLNIICFVIYLLLILISGDRGPIIYLSLAFLFGYLYLNDVKIKTGKIIILTLICSIILSSVATVRSSGNVSDLDSNIVTSNRYYPNSFSPLTQELAGSILTVSTAVYNVPENYNHFYGMFMLQNFSILIPGLNSFANSQFGVKQMNFSSAQFLTFVALGPNATWGVGTSAVADVFLDFGLFGLIFIFLFFGYLMKKLEVNVMGYKTKSFIPVAMYLLYFSFSIYISRANLVVPFTKFAYVAFFYFIIIKRK